MSKLLAVMQLLRLPNVFTAMADIFMGFLIAHGSLEPRGEFLLLLVASSCIYLAGMVLNDWFDVELDGRERPDRPLPSGRIRTVHALAGGIVLIACGLAAAIAAGPISRNVALVLVAAVVAYDSQLKATMIGPALMGLCRTCNVLLGMSTEPGSIWLFDVSEPQALRFGSMVAAGVGLYIMGVTRFARREVEGAHRTDLLSSALGFNFGLLLIAFSVQAVRDTTLLALAFDAPFWFEMNVDPQFSWTTRIATASLIWAAVVLVTNGMVFRAVMGGEPRLMQQAVKTCILALIGLDAAVVAFVVGPVWAAIVLALLIPTLVLGRWVYST